MKKIIKKGLKMVKNGYKAYTLNIWYREDGKNYYRIMRISGEDTLDELSAYILYVFDFDSDHLYAFSTDGNPYDDNSYHFDNPEYKSTDTPIKEVITKVNEGLTYLYDFGDEWFFEIDVKEIEDVDEEIDPEILESVGTLEQYPYLDKSQY
ncbi:MAG: plasmid pRiA4b ORF-3 family protein [Methanobrevibacter sp.]|jgi:hypothetical protein|nr:plasmid pRiA4b ORF-3 family protein [Methanobrevibacter sp.]